MANEEQRGNALPLPLPKSGMNTLDNYEAFDFRIWGGCHAVTGRARTEINHAT